MKKKYVIYKDINFLDPDLPKKIGMPINYRGTVFDFLMKNLYKLYYLEDIFQVILSSKYITRRHACWFALKCVRRIEHLSEYQRGLDALNIAEKYLKGEATKEELKIAKDEAYKAYVDHMYIPYANNIYASIYCTLYIFYGRSSAICIRVAHDSTKYIEEIIVKIVILLEVLDESKSLY